MEEIKKDEGLDLTPDKKPIKLTALKIITALLYGIVTAFLLVMFINLTAEDGEWAGLAYAVYLIVVVLYMGGVGNFITMVTSIVGIIISVKKRSKGCSKKTTKFFVTFAILPVVTEAVFFLAPMLLSAIMKLN